MYFISHLFNNNEKSHNAGGNNQFQIIQFAEVIATEKIIPNKNDKAQEVRDKRYNTDPHIIRCKIVGSKFDSSYDDANLPNCFPLTPKHNNIIPKKGEYVILFLLSENDRYSDRFYIGPIVSTPLNLNKDIVYGGATAGLSIGVTQPSEDLSTLPNSKGVYAEYDSNYQHSIEGRDNSDIVFKSSEVLIRGGKFIDGKPKEYNAVNPAYIQIKHGYNLKNKITGKTEKIGVSNIVANKINLLTYNGGNDSQTDNIFNLTARDEKYNTTPYITDDELNKILETAHPLVFGDKLVQYLELLREAFLSHNHNDFGISSPIQGNPLVLKYILNAKTLEKEMLSKNIKIN
jgi:hypothetical protein